MYGWIVLLAVAYWACIYFMPESPRWLGKVHQTDDMHEVMKLIYKPQYVDNAHLVLSEEISRLEQ